MPTQEVIELRSQLTELGDRARELRSRPRGERSDDWSADIRETRDMIYALDAELQVFELLESIEVRGNGPQVGLQQAPGYEFRTAGEMFTEHDDYEDWVRRGANRESPVIEIERRNLISGIATADGGQTLLPRANPIGPMIQRRRTFLRDLIAPGSTNLSSVPYIRELNPRANELGASAVAEASAKPEIVMQFEAADAPVRTIAAWVPVTRQVIEDVPTMRSYIDGRLGYMVALREEDEMLNGPGTGARLLGIRNFPGVQTGTFAVDKPTSIGRAIALIEVVDGEADGVCINPVEYWTLATTRYANQYDNGAVGSAAGGSPFGQPPQELWGLPVVRSRAIALNEALVGAYRMGAQVFDRHTLQIRVSDSHASLFTSNTSVILAESRLALAVHRPDFFVKVPLS